MAGVPVLHEPCAQAEADGRICGQRVRRGAPDACGENIETNETLSVATATCLFLYEYLPRYSQSTAF